MTDQLQALAKHEATIAPAREKYKRMEAAAIKGDTQSLTYLWQADEEYHTALANANAEYKKSQGV